MNVAGDIEGGEVMAVGPGIVRLDLTTYDSMAHQEGHRVTAVLDLTTARALTIALVHAIERAEAEKAPTRKRKQK